MSGLRIVPMPVASEEQFASWLKIIATEESQLARRAAVGCVVVAFARAQAIAQGVDETQAVQRALETARGVIP